MRAWRRRERYLPAADLPRLLAQLTGRRKHIRPIVVLGLMTGMRKGALLDLRWEHVNLGSEPVFVEVKGRSREIGPNRLLVVRNKLGEPYTVPLNWVARKLLASLREDATEPEFVFKSIVTGLNITDIKRAYNSAHEDAKMSDLTIHDLRHTFTIWAAECGVPLHVRRSLLGHSPSSMTESYTHTTREAEEQAGRCLQLCAGGWCLALDGQYNASP